jgi:hypothetical protein
MSGTRGAAQSERHVAPVLLLADPGGRVSGVREAACAGAAREGPALLAKGWHGSGGAMLAVPAPVAVGATPLPSSLYHITAWHAWTATTSHTAARASSTRFSWSCTSARAGFGAVAKVKVPPPPAPGFR